MKYEFYLHGCKQRADGTVLTDDTAVVTRWAALFEQLFKADPPARMLDISGSTILEADPPISCEPPSLTEIAQVVNQLRGGKAAGICGIQSELLHAGDLHRDSEHRAETHQRRGSLCDRHCAFNIPPELMDTHSPTGSHHHHHHHSLLTPRYLPAAISTPNQCHHCSGDAQLCEGCAIKTTITAENEVEANKLANNYKFGFKKWKSHVTARPWEDRSDIVKELHSDLKTLKFPDGSVFSFGNIIYIILFGWWLCLAYLLVAFLMFLTILGIPYDLLPVVVVALALGYADKENKYASSYVKFSISLLSIIPLSYYIGMAIASISAQSNFAVGAVVNATFGSVIELTFYITALIKGSQEKTKCYEEIVKSALTGTLLGCVLFIPYFIGVTVLAMVPELPEIVNGIQFALQNNISLSIEVGNCIAVQVCMLQIPVLVLFNVFYREALPSEDFQQSVLEKTELDLLIQQTSYYILLRQNWP
ncbi:VNX1 protein, partial [Polypterus senegalus]